MDFDIIDVHHHVGDAFSALGGSIDTPSEEELKHQKAELESRLAIMDSAKVQRAIVIPGHGYLRPNGHSDTQQQNNKIAAYRDRTPERFPAAVGIVEPRDGALSFDELRRIKNELDIKGVSFHTRFQGVSLDSQWIQQYVQLMGELELLPVIHAMDETPEEALWKLGQLARSAPEVPILALDPFSSYEATRQCFFIAEVAPNIVFDTSLSYNFDFIEDFVKNFGAERVAFGTDLYSSPVGRRVSHLLPQIIESSLSDDEKQLILGGNAKRLFGLN